MSFKDGFAAIDQIRTSGTKLADIIAQVEAFKDNLASLEQAAPDLQSTIGDAQATYQRLISTTEALQAAAQEIRNLAQELPKLVETAAAQGMKPGLDELEQRLVALFRDELKDTRASLRDIVELNAAAYSKRLDETQSRIIAEMPRTLFGRRGGRG